MYAHMYTTTHLIVIVTVMQCQDGRFMMDVTNKSTSDNHSTDASVSVTHAVTSCQFVHKLQNRISNRKYNESSAKVNVTTAFSSCSGD